MFKHERVLTLSVLYFKFYETKKLTEKTTWILTRIFLHIIFSLNAHMSKIIKYELKCTLLWRYVCDTEI